MKKILLFLSLIQTMVIFSQKILLAEDFSEDYYAKVYIETKEVFSPGWIGIYEKRTNKELIRVESEELAVDYNEDGKVKTNVLQLPYGEQSVIIYEDFNFDGVKDFAIQDGQNSCYHGPSYQIYLVNNGSPVFSSEFTRLAQEYCGMFNVDTEGKRIYTMTKSGCCWHQFSEFEVKKNIPIAIRIEEEGMSTNGCFWEHNTLIRGGKEEKYFQLAWEDIKIIFMFTIAQNKKKVVVFECNGELQYAFIKPDNKIEFTYPGEIDGKKFTLIKNANNKYLLNFSTLDAGYSIYKDEKNVGVKVTVDGKNYDLSGDLSTWEGELETLWSKKAYPNVFYK